MVVYNMKAFTNLTNQLYEISNLGHIRCKNNEISCILIEVSFTHIEQGVFSYDRRYVNLS